MIYNDLFDIVVDLPFDTPQVIYEEGDSVLYIIRPSVVSKRYKHYDLHKNFQIFMKEGNNTEFKPNHLRILISLNLWIRNNPYLCEELSLAFDQIFNGEDPSIAIINLNPSEYIGDLNSLGIIAHLAQCFYIEQNYSFASKSNFDPPSLYLHGWVRTFINSEAAIDQLIWRICRNTPPAIGYTYLDNKLDYRYTTNPPELWYL